MSLRARLLLFVAVPLTVIAVLAAGGVLWWRWNTARQPKLSNDIPAMDQAITATIRSAGNHIPLAISGVFESSLCTVGPLNQGGHFTRSVDFYTNPGDEGALIDRMARVLPTTYQPQRGTPIGNNARPLTATVTAGVDLSVDQISPGWVVARARTGCSSGAPAEDITADIAATPGADTLHHLLTALGTQAAQTRRQSLACPGGITTVAVITEPTNAGDLAGRLGNQIPANSNHISTQSNRIAYRQDGTSVIVAASDDNTAVTIEYTSPC